MKLRKNTASNQLEAQISHEIVSTRIDGLNAVFPEIDSAFAHSESWSSFVIDLQGCEMVDSAGLNFLITLHKTLDPLGCRIRLMHCSKNLLRTFRFSRLDRYVDLVE